MPQKSNVKVYTTTSCPYCKLAKDFLTENKIRFVEVNVEDSQEAASEMVEKSGQMGVPIIDVNGQIIVGFDREALKKALKIK